MYGHSLEPNNLACEVKRVIGSIIMNNLYAGFARVNVTPMMGIGVAGYFQVRLADGVLDELEVNALALACGDEKVVLMTIDNCGIETLILPESLCTIEKGSVVNCKQLKSLVVEGGSGGIGAGAFAGNDALEDIWFPSGSEVFTGDIFADASPVNVTFHVKEGSWAQRYAQEKGFSIAIE